MYKHNLKFEYQLSLGPHKAQCLLCLETIFMLEHFSWLKPFHSYLKLGHL